MDEPGLRDAVTETGPPAGTSRLSVEVAADVPPVVAAAVLGPGRDRWLGRPLVATGHRIDRYELDLEMPLGDGRPHVALRKAAVVDIGPLEGEMGGRLCAPISWRAASLAPLFPVFSGSLCWGAGALRIDGYYAPPGGRLGVAADRILLRLVADRTARWLLERILQAMADDQSRSSR